MYWMHSHLTRGLQDAFLSVWCFQQPRSINHTVNLRFYDRTLLPQTHWNVWFLARTSLSLSKVSGSGPNGCPGFSSVTLPARNNGRRALETFTSFNVFTFSNGFSVQMGQWQQTAQADSRQRAMWDGFFNWAEDGLVEPRNVMTELQSTERDWRCWRPCREGVMGQLCLVGGWCVTAGEKSVQLWFQAYKSPLIDTCPVPNLIICRLWIKMDMTDLQKWTQSVFITAWWPAEV